MSCCSCHHVAVASISFAFKRELQFLHLQYTAVDYVSLSFELISVYRLGYVSEMSDSWVETTGVAFVINYEYDVRLP